MSGAKKVLWICGFSNEGKRSHLRQWCSWRGGEYGQWIPNLLRGFGGQQGRFDIHVVSTDSLLVNTFQSWTENHITYHCFKSGIPFLGRDWHPRIPVDHLTHFILNRRRIKRIVDEVKPDLIHLFGVENPHYGAAVLDLVEQYPVFVTIQGFVHRERQYHNTVYTRCRCRYEDKLLRACRQFSGDYDSESVVRSFNPEVTYRHVYFPVNEPLIERTPVVDEKPYDLLFVGALTRQKGIGDFFEVVRLLVAERPNLLTAVVGRVGDYPPAADYIVQNKLEKNVQWVGRFPSQEGLFKVYRQSKLFLAPTYNDAFPSTIRECMLLGTPVIAYVTGGIPWANRDGKTNVILVSQGNVQDMADAALQLLNDTTGRAKLAADARTFAQNEFSLKTNVDTILDAYEKILGVNA